jgi:NAD(P)H dehydrogenase (quinone)
VRSKEKGAELALLGVNISIGDYEDFDSLVSAFQGVEKLLMVSATDLTKRAAQHATVIKAAKVANVKHVIYTSGGRTIETPESLLWVFMKAHIETEKLLAASGLKYTILNNGLYLDTIPLFIGDVLQSGVIYLPAGNGKMAWALRSEMAEAAAEVLVTEGHENKRYVLTNTEAYGYQDVADQISEITGIPVSYVSPTKVEFVDTLAQSGISIPEEYVSIILAQANGEGNFVSDDLEKFLGRKPTTLKEYLSAIYKS